MKKGLFILGCFLIIIPLAAHEFWLQPDKFILKPGQTVNIRFWVGENFEGENWSGSNKKINTLFLNTQKGSKDIAALLSGAAGDSLKLNIAAEGTAMVLYNSINSFISLEPKKFNTYLKEDGLQNAIEYRSTNNENDSTGKEFYQRSVKTIVQVGKKITTNILGQTSLPLDIVPLQNPYGAANKDSLRFKIFFNKKLLAQQLIKIWHRVNNKTSATEITTNAAGEIAIKNTRSGKWMVSTVKMIRLQHEPKADWQSYWA
ncbi:MAG: DUF4198 domain-containing protein, partial [Ferruginibacter sp.]